MSHCFECGPKDLAFIFPRTTVSAKGLTVHSVIPMRDVVAIYITVPTCDTICEPKGLRLFDRRFRNFPLSGCISRDHLSGSALSAPFGAELSQVVEQLTASKSKAWIGERTVTDLPSFVCPSCESTSLAGSLMCYNCGVAWIFKNKLHSDVGIAPFEFSPTIAT